MSTKQRFTFDRRNTSPVGCWWWTVDKPLLFSLLVLAACGAVLVTAASPPVAARIGLDDFYFVVRQQLFLGVGVAVMLVISMLDNRMIRRLAVLGFVGSIVLMMLLPFIAPEIKGAKRWLSIAGITLQPSEFLKPFFAVVVAWVLAERYRINGFPGYKLAIALFAVSGFLLVIQPDIGMMITLAAIFGVQMFLAGIPLFLVVMMGVLAVGGMVAAYHLLPHVQSRINRFLDPQSGDNYQVDKSLEAIQNGGVFGQGPGEGQVKWSIPDSHTDFIFAVAAEEFGMVLALGIVFLMAFIVVRALTRLWREPDLFVLFAVAGIITQFGVQAFINIGVSVNLLPAKGMTLPFLSYGGSSLLATAIAMGMVLGLTRSRYGEQSNASGTVTA